MPAVAATPRIKPQQLLVSPKRSFRYEHSREKRPIAGLLDMSNK
jgi:hypothetical protein